jgi:hypothetical protein
MSEKKNNNNEEEDNNNEKTHKFICEKCNYKCNFDSQWTKHCDTELHKTGKRKKRTDKQEVGKCKQCEYETESYTTMLKHLLNKHSTKEERKDKFKHYCELCDFGTFSKDTFDIHENSNKHKVYIVRSSNK